MASCVHQQWLRLNQDNNGFVLQYNNRLQYVTSLLPRPSRQFPSLIFFISKDSKTRALRCLFPGNSVLSCRRSSIADICIDPATVDNDYPTLLANSSLDHVQASHRGRNACHETTSYPIAWPDGGLPAQQDPSGYVRTRLLLLFTNVLCIFAQDCGGLDRVAEILTTWTTISSASSLPGSTKPRLVIVANVSGADF